ncbi:unnamed protein product [Leuciscus chuanchicus]
MGSLMLLEVHLAGVKMVGVRSAHPHPHLNPNLCASFLPQPTLFSAYAPTLDAEHNIKEDFYRALDAILQKTLATDRLILMGDFNSRVGPAPSGHYKYHLPDEEQAQDHLAAPPLNTLASP